MRSFRSDNNSGLCPEALKALVAANDGSHVIGYGDDAYTQQAESAFRDLFGDETALALVATGTAANTLAVAALTEPWQCVLCHRHSHWGQHESTAPERMTGCRTLLLEGRQGKLHPEDLEGVGSASGADVHEPQPGVLTISNPTELGLVYRPEELAALCETAHTRGYRVHVDGARFANAVAAVGCDPRDLSTRAGVDALSFGGTKNGLALGEAVLLFRQGDGSEFERARRRLPFLRKSSGHLISKHRFVAAPFRAVLESGAWLEHARHSNAMASMLGEGLTALGLALAIPVESNGVFVALPPPVADALAKAEQHYYGFGDPARPNARLLCSFDTSERDVQDFLDTVRSALA